MIGLIYFKHYRLIFHKISNLKETGLKFNFWVFDLFILLFLIIFLFLALNTIGEVIHLGDPVVMWNEWSKDVTEIKFQTQSDYPLTYQS